MLTDAKKFDLWSRESYAEYTEAHKAFANAVEAEATAELRAENERLRESLRNIAASVASGQVQRIANAALAGGEKT